MQLKKTKERASDFGLKSTQPNGSSLKFVVRTEKQRFLRVAQTRPGSWYSGRCRSISRCRRGGQSGGRRVAAGRNGGRLSGRHRRGRGRRRRRLVMQGRSRAVRVGFDVSFELAAATAAASVIAGALTAGTVLRVLLILRVEIVESVRHYVFRVDRFLRK